MGRVKDDVYDGKFGTKFRELTQDNDAGNTVMSVSADQAEIQRQALR